MPDGSRPESIYRLNSDEHLRTINMLVYSHIGVGKTPFWGTGEKLLLMDSDNGVESAAAFGSTVDVAPATDFKEISEIWQYLAYGKHDYRWAVWDGGTLFMDRVLIDEVLPDAVAKKPREGNAEFVADRGEYLVVQNRFSDYIRRFVSLPINFGMSAHVMTAADPEGELVYVPFLPGQKGEFSSKICGYMNIVAYLGITPKGTRRLLTERRGYYTARDRFNAIHTQTSKGRQGFLDNPTVPKVEALVEQARKRINNGQGQASGRQRVRRAGAKRR